MAAWIFSAPSILGANGRYIKDRPAGSKSEIFLIVNDFARNAPKFGRDLIRSLLSTRMLEVQLSGKSQAWTGCVALRIAKLLACLTGRATTRGSSQIIHRQDCLHAEVHNRPRVNRSILEPWQIQAQKHAPNPGQRLETRRCFEC